MFKYKLLPSVYFYSLLIIFFILHAIIPIIQVVNAPHRYVGIGVIILGAIINLMGNQSFYRAGVLESSVEVQSELVTTGFYRFSRNPMYLGGIIILLGESILLGSIITFAAPVLFFLAVSMIVIPKEEKDLETKFGEEYLKYKKTVRRWV